MSVTRNNIFWLGSAVMSDDDTDLNIGGALATNIGFTGGYRKVVYNHSIPTATVQVVSENAGDTGSVTIVGRDSAGVIQQEIEDLNGQTPAATTQVLERLLKATIDESHAGAFAVESSTLEHGATADGGGADYLDLDDASANAAANYYDGMVLRSTSGTGANQIREILWYEGSAGTNPYRAHFRTVSPSFDATTVYQIRKGMVFELADYPIGEVRRISPDASADVLGGSAKYYYEKVFVCNKHASLSLTNCQIVELVAGLSTSVEFDLETSLDGNDTNGAGNNRQVAPGGYTFDSAAKDVGDSGDGIFDYGKSQGIWVKTTLAAGASAQNSYYPLQVEGDLV